MVGGGGTLVSGIGTRDSTALSFAFAAWAGRLRAARTTARAVPANRSPRRIPRIDKFPSRHCDARRNPFGPIQQKRGRDSLHIGTASVQLSVQAAGPDKLIARLSRI